MAKHAERLSDIYPVIKATIKGKFVCANCFTDYAIQMFIKSHARRRICTYCSRQSTRLISASLIDVLGYIIEGMRSEWVINTPEIEWKAENLDWYGGREWPIPANTMVKSLLPELAKSKDKLLQDIVDSIPAEWRPRQDYSAEPETYFSYRWDEFANTVKYRTRYVYYRVNTDWQKDIERRDKHSWFKIGSSHVMEEVLDKISAMDITYIIPTNTLIWRARSHDANESFNTPEELGSPPVQLSISTRMSPSGIPVFYGSFNRETAIAETLATEQIKETSRAVTIGQWKTLQDFRVLNFAKIPAKPSIFDSEKRRLRHIISFIDCFAYEITQPLFKDDNKSIEYVPTQVFAEYIRHIYRDREGNSIDGILYKSAVRERGINCVLFITNNDCINDIESKARGKTNTMQKMILEATEKMYPSKARIKRPLTNRRL